MVYQCMTIGSIVQWNNCTVQPGILRSSMIYGPLVHVPPLLTFGSSAGALAAA